ncbi:NAD(P)H-binding protein [Actinomycetospora sp. OC33-EN08]|uniref:NAD(P)H-binding protein n=1 Tax=Actinomycetospora aurantiaca TaxID=3129233 RepID=A0ABU8MVX0_9PSEU
MHVVVLGARGGSGRAVVVEALGAGHRVTAAVRDPDAFHTLGITSNRLHVARVDVRDEESLVPVIDGQDVVVFAAGPPGRRAHGLYSQGAQATVAAMTRCRVDRLLAITSAGVRYDDHELAPWYRLLVRPLLGEIYADMSLMEQVVRASDLDWTLVRPVLLLDREPVGDYRVLDAATPRRGRTITRADLAQFIVGEIDERRWSRQAPTLAH